MTEAEAARLLAQNNRVLNGINRIFREALAAPAAPALVRRCLQVAEEVTGAANGFLGEVAAGEAAALVVCTVEGADAPREVAIGAAAAAALRAGRSVVENRGPGEIVVHPPLRNVLAVPLVEGGRTVAVIGLGDRPGGFGEEDRAAAEALAPAILTALRSRRAEAALRGSEQRLQALVGGIPQLVWRAEGDGCWTWASRQWTDFTGQAEAASRDLGWLDALHPADRAAAREAWAAAAERGEFHADYRIRHAADGGYRWFQARAVPVRDGEGAIAEWLGTSTDVDDLRRLQDRQQVLVGELQHRVRNILTVVRSVFTRTVESDEPLEEVAYHFKGRLDALARTQVSATRSASGLVDLENLIRDELLSAGVSDGPQVTIAGPEVALSPRMAEPVGLAIHELTTNALKFGALRATGATLAINWTTDLGCGAPGYVHLTWEEQGVPAVPVVPARPGFGSELIEEALPYRLGAETKLEFRGGGIRCTITVPLPDGTAAAEAWKGVVT